jgi:crossover junction endodeoxyribonuclease RusA
VPDVPPSEPGADAMTLHFVVAGVPQPQGSTRAFMRPGMRYPVVTSTTKGLHSWRHLIATEAARTGIALQGPIAMRAAFYLPRPKSLGKKTKPHLTRPDLDKLVRSVGDALSGVCYRDDAQIVDLHVWKHYAGVGEPPRVEISLTELRDVCENQSSLALA